MSPTLELQFFNVGFLLVKALDKVGLGHRVSSGPLEVTIQQVRKLMVTVENLPAYHLMG